MENPTKLDPNLLHLLEVKIIKGMIESPFEFETEEIEGFDFDLNFDMGFSLEEKLGKADFEISVQTKSEGKNEAEALSSFHFAFVFVIENLSELLTKKGKKEMVVDHGLANAIASITYSTTRGILLTRFKGTAFEDFILPVINPNQLLEDKG